MTLLESSGQALIWDLMEGREIGRPMLPEYPNLQGLKAMYLEGQIVLLPKRRVRTHARNKTSNCKPSKVRFITGSMVCTRFRCKTAQCVGANNSINLGGAH